MNSPIRDLCEEYTDDLKYHDPDTGQTIILIDRQYFLDLFVRAKNIDFCCTHVSKIGGSQHLVRFEKVIEELGKSADWWKNEI